MVLDIQHTTVCMVVGFINSVLHFKDSFLMGVGTRFLCDCVCHVMSQGLVWFILHNRPTLFNVHQIQHCVVSVSCCTMLGILGGHATSLNPPFSCNCLHC